MLQQIKEYFEGFNGFSDKSICINTSTDSTESVCLRELPCKRTVRKYADGGEIRQFIFEINTFAPCNADLSDLTEDLAQYVKQGMPNIGGALFFEVIKSGAVKDNSTTKIKYQIVLRLVYSEGSY